MTADRKDGNDPIAGLLDLLADINRLRLQPFVSTGETIAAKPRFEDNCGMVWLSHHLSTMELAASNIQEAKVGNPTAPVSPAVKTILSMLSGMFD